MGCVMAVLPRTGLFDRDHVARAGAKLNPRCPAQMIWCEGQLLRCVRSRQRLCIWCGRAGDACRIFQVKRDVAHDCRACSDCKNCQKRPVPVCTARTGGRRDTNWPCAGNAQNDRSHSSLNFAAGPRCARRQAFDPRSMCAAGCPTA